MRLRNLFDNPRNRIRLVVFPTLFALGLTFFAVITNALGAAEHREQAEASHVHTLEVLLVTGEMETTVHAALRGERGYLLTVNRRFLRPYLTSRQRAWHLLEQMRGVTRDNPKQQANVDRLEAELVSYFDVLHRTVSLAADGELPQALKMVRDGVGRDRVEALLAVIKDIENEERRLLAERRGASEEANRQIDRSGWALVAAGLLLLLLLSYSSFAALIAGERAARATEELRRLATTDELTGLANRRSLLDGLERESARALRNGNPLSLAILDVDHFKNINDLHGHPIGDQVLRVVASVLRDGTRTSDIVGRIGGEEFAVLMPETGHEQAVSVCERLCQAMERMRIELPDGAHTAVTISTGVAMLVEGESPSHLVSRADGALYEAKFGGRNQVKLAA